jgi:hypothetical protein
LWVAVARRSMSNFSVQWHAHGDKLGRARHHNKEFGTMLEIIGSMPCSKG